MKVNETVSNVVIQKKVSQPEPLVGAQAVLMDQEELVLLQEGMVQEICL